MMMLSLLSYNCEVMAVDKMVQTLILLDDVANWMTLARRVLGCGKMERASEMLEGSSLGGH